MTDRIDAAAWAHHGRPVVTLVRPDPTTLPGFVDALGRGWSPDNLRPQAAAEALAAIAADPQGLFATVDDVHGLGPPVTLPDGTVKARLPGLLRWLWDDEGFAGTINLRWSPAHAPLPPFVLGHIGYAVVPWKQRRGYATQALAQLLPVAREHGLPFVEITTDADNIGSQRVITANGGVLMERFDKPVAYGGAASLRFRITLD